MAYMSQENKKRIRALLKKELADTGLKWSLAVENHSAIALTFRSGPVDFHTDRVFEHWETDSLKPGAYFDVNPYHYGRHFQGKSLDVLERAFRCLQDGNHDRSDSMTDYFDVGWYVRVHVGRWDKPYVLTT